MTHTQVAELGTLTEFHREPLPYNLKALVKLVTDLRPDLLCLDITPDQWQRRDFADLPAEYPEALLPLAHQMADDRVWLIDALLAQAEFPANNREELRPNLRMAEQGLDLARELGDKRRELSSLMNVARIRLTLRESNSLSIAEEALELARQLGDLSSEVSILLRIGNAYGVDNLSRSREYLEAALAKSESLNDKRFEIPLLDILGRQFEREGDYYRQLTQYEHKRLKLSREIGDRYVEGNALMFCGQIQALYLGDYEAGLSRWPRSMAPRSASECWI